MQVSSKSDFDSFKSYYQQDNIEIKEPIINRIINRSEYKMLISEYWDLNIYRMIWEILYETGMRPIEACALQIQNIGISERLICYKVYKPSKKKCLNGTFKQVYKSRTVPITKELTIKLKNYIDMNSYRIINGFLFPSFRVNGKHPHFSPRSLNKEMERLRIKFKGRWLKKNSQGHSLISPHSFRRSWITRHLNMYKNPPKTSRAIGHSDMKTTFGYYQELNMDDERLFVNRDKVVVCIPENISKEQTTLSNFI